MKKRFDTFNSGVLKICEPLAAVSDFNAVKNVTTESELSELYAMPYNEETRRQSDTEFAESSGHRLDLKVKIRRAKGIGTDKRVLIGRRLYSIYQADYSADRTVLYLYLELEREIYDGT